jgi:hypothetical protein
MGKPMNRLMRLSFLTLFTLHFSLFTFSQSDSCTLRISLLTCSPGTELYSTFGHSALRVIDPAAGTDIVYNYGVFDFYDPQFYAKFVRGKLLYYLDQEAFPDFLYAYQRENRSVVEQVLELDCKEKTAMQEFLFNNIRPENRSYKYDFLFDNCTTRLRDLILTQQGKTYQTGNIMGDQSRSFRDHIHYYLDMNKMPWSKLGIDILLGSKLDRPMTNAEAMFLPDYLEKGLDSSSTNTSLVRQKTTLFQRDEHAGSNAGFPLSPKMLGWFLFGLAVFCTYHLHKISKKILAGIDFTIFLLTGLVGILLVFMWTGTDHLVCRNNLNLLWALPTHTLAAFFTGSRRTGWKTYYLVTAAIAALLIVTWPFLPQQLNTALMPFVLIIAIRSWMLSGRQNGAIWKKASSSAARN